MPVDNCWCLPLRFREDNVYKVLCRRDDCDLLEVIMRHFDVRRARGWPEEDCACSHELLKIVTKTSY